ncbi:putative thioredoxin [Neisseria meningitidis]|nr:putative thioredoxin [Neisseria meningitidis]
MKKILTAAVVALIGILLAIVLIPDSKTAPAFSLSDLHGKTRFQRRPARQSYPD